MTQNKVDYQPVIDQIKKTYPDYAAGGFVPLHAATFSGNEKKYLDECIDTTFVSSVGEFVNRFERDIAAYTGAAKAVVCVSGTNGLHMALMLAGVERGDEVITQPLTFIATANAISYCGAYPVFVDVDRDTMGLSPSKMAAWLAEHAEVRDGQCCNKGTGRRIKACVPMHTFGHPVHLDELVALCREWHIELVEDAAESLGSFYKGRHTGTFGRVGVLSFNGNKTITTGGGGMLLFNAENIGLAERAKHLTTQAKVPHRWEFVHDAVGYNYRMPNINAALGCAQLECLPGYVESKRQVAEEYRAYFNNHPSGIEFFSEPADTRSNYWLNAVILPDHEAQIEFLTQTNDSGVMTRPIWELMNRLPMFADAECGDLSTAEWLADRVVNIPSSVRL
ncbi:MAG: LegC family aminotransferase [Rikenellaceae bacterium]|nr:LegC family aminotransferase [Rikenellaceae bacterium]